MGAFELALAGKFIMVVEAQLTARRYGSTRLYKYLELNWISLLLNRSKKQGDFYLYLLIDRRLLQHLANWKQRKGSEISGLHGCQPSPGSLPRFTRRLLCITIIIHTKKKYKEKVLVNMDGRNKRKRRGKAITIKRQPSILVY